MEFTMPRWAGHKGASGHDISQGCELVIPQHICRDPIRKFYRKRNWNLEMWAWWSYGSVSYFNASAWAKQNWPASETPPSSSLVSLCRPSSQLSSASGNSEHCLSRVGILLLTSHEHPDPTDLLLQGEITASFPVNLHQPPTSPTHWT